MDAKVFHPGDPVIKAGGDRGTVIAAFRDRSSGEWRYVVVDDRGRSTDTPISTTGATERVAGRVQRGRLGWRRPPRGRRGPDRHWPVPWSQPLDHIEALAEARAPIPLTATRTAGAPGSSRGFFF